MKRWLLGGLVIVLLTGCAMAPPGSETLPTQPALGQTASTVDVPSSTPAQTARPDPSISTQNPVSPPSTAAVAPSTPPPPPPQGEVDCRKQKCVALTLDDGPSPLSNKFLDLLKEKQVPATFFVVGNRVPQFPGTVKRMAAEGHIVGNHSYSHKKPSKLSAEQLATEISKASKLITAQTGEPVTLFRPPFGELGAAVRKASKTDKVALIMWNIDTLDWKTRDTDKVVKQVLADVRPGSILLTHELYKTTLDAYPIIIDKLRAKGYVFVSIPQLLGKAPKPGTVYFGGLKPKK